MSNDSNATPDVGRPVFDEQAAIDRARIRSAQFHEQNVKPTARDSAGTKPPEPTGCQCKTPLPKHHENNVHICARCGSTLQTTSDGKVYRRLPGDLDTREQQLARGVLEVARASKEEMAELVKALPFHQQKKLMALPQKKFEKVARKMIRIHQAAKAAGPLPLGPNARRRAMRKQAAIADVVDDIAEAVATHRSPLDQLDEFIKNVQNHEHRPEPEIISQAEHDRRRREGP